MSPSSPFSLVLFDLGSTLIYFDGAWDQVFPRSNANLIRELHAAGYQVDPFSFSETFNRNLEIYRQERESEFIEHTTLYVLRKLLEEVGYPDVEEQPLRTALKAMYSVSQSFWRLEDDALPTLQILRDHDFRLGLISNAADDADIQTLVDIHGLRDSFDLILSSAQFGWRKPHPRIFNFALQFFQAEPRQAVMVGDTLGADILGAKNLGIASVWITRRADRISNRVHEDTIQPDAVIASLSELPPLLANWDHRPSSTLLPIG